MNLLWCKMWRLTSDMPLRIIIYGLPLVNFFKFAKFYLFSWSVKDIGELEDKTDITGRYSGYTCSEKQCYELVPSILRAKM